MEMINTNFKIGDYVTRVSHDHDIVFKIIRIEQDIAYLKGVNFRLCADSQLSDLVVARDLKNNDKEIIDDNINCIDLKRDQYFYLPGTILHIDGDEDYLSRCMNFYEKMNVKANGIHIPEPEMSTRIYSLLEQFHPDILVLTGHDALYSNNKNSDKSSYQNSNNYIDAVKESRRYEKNQDKLIIVAGACQSDYEDLIKAGANFASSPKRINIHALDPAVIAVSLAFSDKNQSIDLINLINKTKFGSDGIGGIITNGTMYVGYPR